MPLPAFPAPSWQSPVKDLDTKTVRVLVVLLYEGMKSKEMRHVTLRSSTKPLDDLDLGIRDGIIEYALLDHGGIRIGVRLLRRQHQPRLGAAGNGFAVSVIPDHPK